VIRLTGDGLTITPGANVADEQRDGVLVDVLLAAHDVAAAPDGLGVTAIRRAGLVRTALLAGAAEQVFERSMCTNSGQLSSLRHRGALGSSVLCFALGLSQGASDCRC
jgi:hypothetical protein